MLYKEKIEQARRLGCPGERSGIIKWDGSRRPHWGEGKGIPGKGTEQKCWGEGVPGMSKEQQGDHCASAVSEGVGEKRKIRSGADSVGLTGHWEDFCLYSGRTGETIESFKRGRPWYDSQFPEHWLLCWQWTIRETGARGASPKIRRFLEESERNDGGLE